MRQLNNHLNNYSMSKVTHQIEIDNYEKVGDSIEVHFSNPGEEENTVMKISREAFEDFLSVSGRLEGTMSKDDELASYTIPVADYWSGTYIKIIYADLKAYLLLIKSRDEAAELKKHADFLYDWLANTGAVAYEGVMTQAHEELQKRVISLSEYLPCYGKQVHVVTTDLAS